MAKYSMSVYRLKKPINLADVKDVKYAPCVAGAEFTIGTVGTGPMVETTWTHGGFTFLEVRYQSRKVPKKWLDAEKLRRFQANDQLTMEEKVAISAQIEAELWHKILPTDGFAWVAYHPGKQLLFVKSAPRMAEEVTGMLRQGLGSLPVDAPFCARGFSLLVRAYIGGHQDTQDLELRIGYDLELSGGSGSSKRTMRLRNVQEIYDNEDLAAEACRFENAESAGFILYGDIEQGNDFVSNSYGDLTISYIKDKQDDEYGTMLLQANRAFVFIESLVGACLPYTQQKGEKVQ